MADVIIKLTGKEYNILITELREHAGTLAVEMPRTPGQERRDAAQRLNTLNEVCKKVFA